MTDPLFQPSMTGLAPAGKVLSAKADQVRCRACPPGRAGSSRSSGVRCPCAHSAHFTLVPLNHEIPNDLTEHVVCRILAAVDSVVSWQRGTI